MADPYYADFRYTVPYTFDRALALLTAVGAAVELNWADFREVGPPTERMSLPLAELLARTPSEHAPLDWAVLWPNGIVDFSPTTYWQLTVEVSRSDAGLMGVQLAVTRHIRGNWSIGERERLRLDDVWAARRQPQWRSPVGPDWDTPEWDEYMTRVDELSSWPEAWPYNKIALNRIFTTVCHSYPLSEARLDVHFEFESPLAQVNSYNPRE